MSISMPKSIDEIMSSSMFRFLNVGIPPFFSDFPIGVFLPDPLFTADGVPERLRSLPSKRSSRFDFGGFRSFAFSSSSFCLRFLSLASRSRSWARRSSMSALRICSEFALRFALLTKSKRADWLALGTVFTVIVG